MPYTKETVAKWNDMPLQEKNAIWNTLSEQEQEAFEADFDKHLNSQRKRVITEDPVLNASHPAPLLADKKAALPEGSKERKFYENVEKTLDGTASNNKEGLDNLTREDVKATQQLVRSSPLLQEGVKPPRPDKLAENGQEASGPETIAGEEEGKVVSNLQSWTGPIANAVKPISDAIGSSFDTAAGLVTTPLGAIQALPTAVNAIVDNISSEITNQVDSITKTIQSSGLGNMASKALGSLRNLATAGDKILSTAFDLLADVSNGIDKIITALSSIVDKIMLMITNFAISLIGGLINAMFPPPLLEKIVNSLGKMTGNLGQLSQMLGGFTAVTSITDQLGGLTNSVTSVLSNPTNLIKAYMPSPASLMGKIPGGEMLSSLTNKIPGAQGVRSGSFGNLGAIIGGVDPKIGSMLPSIRDPKQLLSSFVPPEIGSQIDKIDQIPGLGMIGNPGFSVGKAMDSLIDTATTKAMGKYATHASIIGPLLNKQIGGGGQSGFATEPQPDQFQQQPFVPGAQGNKGFTMVGPIGTQFQRVFAGSYATIGGGGPTPSAQQQASATTAPAASHPTEMGLALAEKDALLQELAKKKGISVEEAKKLANVT